MSYFCFSISDVIAKKNEPIAILFYNHNGDNSQELDPVIESFTNRRISPVRILIVCPYGIQERIKIEYAQLSNTARERLQIVSHVNLLSYGSDGGIKDAVLLEGNNWDLKDADLLRYSKLGLREMINNTGVIWSAPTGYLFISKIKKLAMFLSELVTFLKILNV